MTTLSSTQSTPSQLLHLGVSVPRNKKLSNYELTLKLDGKARFVSYRMSLPKNGLVVSKLPRTYKETETPEKEKTFCFEDLRPPAGTTCPAFFAFPIALSQDPLSLSVRVTHSKEVIFEDQVVQQVFNGSLHPYYTYVLSVAGSSDKMKGTFSKLTKLKEDD